MLISTLMEENQGRLARTLVRRSLHLEVPGDRIRVAIGMRRAGKTCLMIQAMQDPDIQAIAWKKHGFRSLTGAPNDPSAFPLVSVPQNVVTTDLPSVDMIQKLLDCLRDNVCQ